MNDHEKTDLEKNKNEKDELENSIFETGNHQAIQILVFPPRNKKFRVDEKTKSIQIEPILYSPSFVECDNNKPCVTGEVARSETKYFEENKYQVGNRYFFHKNRVSSGGYKNDSCTYFSKNNIYVKQVLKLRKEFKNKKCFLKGCKWSPDGFCLLSCSEDNVLRLFEIPENVTNVNLKESSPVLKAKEGGTIYDYEWYPKMNSSDPVSCVFASTSQNSPIHLWDAYSGCLRATYQPINQYDEVTAAYSLAFSPDGCKIFSGFKKFVRIFEISLPGRVFEERSLKNSNNSVFQTNIISCITINPVMPKIYALGSYDRTIGIYTEPDGELQCLLNGHRGGITQIMFSHDGIRLYSGARKDSEIICWDLRSPGKILFILKRVVNTNQRIYFHLSKEGSHLATGSTDEKILIYDTSDIEAREGLYTEPVIEWKAHNDCVNGVNFHPFRSVLASSSGQHHFNDSVLNYDEEEENLIGITESIDNSIKIWSVNLEGNML